MPTDPTRPACPRTTGAGYCIVASASRGEQRPIAVVLGAATEESRNVATAAVLDWEFAQP